MADSTASALDGLKGELSTLNRVSHRLAMTEGGAFEKVVMALLPRLLLRIGKNDDDKKANLRSINNKRKSPSSDGEEETGSLVEQDAQHDAIHKKLIEMISHILKRTRSDHDCKLPCLDVLGLLLPRSEGEEKVSANPFTVNLGLAFLTLGMNRCSPTEAADLLPGLLEFIGSTLQSVYPNAAGSNNNDTGVDWDAQRAVGVTHLLDPIAKTRHNQAYHLILRCLERVSNNPTESAAARRNNEGNKTDPSSTESGVSLVSSLHETKQLLSSRPILSAAMFDLFTDVMLYNPVPANSTLVPSGLSTASYQCLVGGAASQSSGATWKDEFSTRSNLKTLKLKLLDLVAPCRRFALFLPEKSEGMGSGDGISRTVALMTLLSGDTDPDIKNKAESYLRAHMDTYRGRKELPSGENGEAQDQNATTQDYLLGNSVSLAQTLLVFSVGGASSLIVDKSLRAQYTNDEAKLVIQSRLGLRYSADSVVASQQKALLSSTRTKVSETAVTSCLKFVAKMMDDNPKMLAQTNMERDESDAKAVSIGTRVLAILGDLNRPGSSTKPTMEAAVSLLNSLCVRISMFYDSRLDGGSNVMGSTERLRQILARAMAGTCSILAPTASGESSSPSSNSTRAANIQIEVRNSAYGVVSTLARSKFSVDTHYAVFDCGKTAESVSAAISTSTAVMLFGCAANEADVLRPRATSALDALLGSYVRVVEVINQTGHTKASAQPTPNAGENPWATLTATAASQQILPDHVSADALARSLFPLMWTASSPKKSKSSRIGAVRWTASLLLGLDKVNAVHLLCFLTGDEDMTVSMIAKQALRVDKTLGEDDVLCTKDSAVDDTVPFEELVHILLIGETESPRPQYVRFHVRAQTATIRFLLQQLYSEDSLYGGADDCSRLVATALNSLASYKGKTLSREETDLTDECSIVLSTCTSNSRDARKLVIGNAGFGAADLSAQALTSNSSKTRRHFALAVGHLYEDQSLWGDGSQDLSLGSWAKSTKLLFSAKACEESLHTLSGTNLVVGQVHGAAFLGAACVRAFRLAAAESSNPDTNAKIVDKCWERIASIVSLLGEGLAHADVAIGNACSRGLVVAFSYESRDAPILDGRLFSAFAKALAALNGALKRFSSIDHSDATRAGSLIEAAGLLLAASTSGAGHTQSGTEVDLGPTRLQCVEALFAILGSTVYRKDDELALSVGEALARYADAIGSGEWSTGKDCEEWLEKYDEVYASALPPHRHVLFTLFQRDLAASNPLKRNACAAALLALVGHCARNANADESSIQRSFFLEVWKHLSLFQEAFLKLLADPKSKQLSRESCCKGLAACRGLVAAMATSDCSDAQDVAVLNDKLLRAFGQTTNYGGSAMMETEGEARERRNTDNDVAGEGVDRTDVGGAAGISEASLEAYKEMAACALSLNQVDVLYSLMILSTNHPVWSVSTMNDKYSARALLGKANGATIEEIRVSLRPHLKNLVPKLLRACNDPSKMTATQMNVLWVALTGGGSESRALISEHLLSTIDSLIKDAGSKLWKARAGACGALSDVIVGRSWNELGGGGVEVDDEGIFVTSPTASLRLIRLWKVAMRAIDDVRTPVRERGEALGRGVKALTIRLCDPTSTDTLEDKDIFLSDLQRREKEKETETTAEYAATVSLGWLVKYGLNQACAEATGICISTLLGVVEVAKPSTLQPVLSELIGSLLMAMSGLEPAALNYLQVRAAGNDSESNAGERLERMRINLASSGPIAGALQKCLDMVKDVSIETQRNLVPELDSALRKGAGFNTRAAVADAVASLCSTCPAAFQCKTGSTMSNPTVRLFRALYFASERERGALAKDKMIHSLGYLAELTPGKAVRTLSVNACDRYNESSGSNNDENVRRAAAATCRAIAVRAPSHLIDGGPGNVWVRKVLPTAYIGMHDKETKIASLWKEVWEEGGSAISSVDGRDNVFGVLLQEKLLPSITRAIVKSLQSTSWDNRRKGCDVLLELCKDNVLAPTARTSDGTFCDNDIDRLKQRAEASASLLSECVAVVSKRRVWDGKGDVAKAGTTIAGKWASIAPIDGETAFILDITWPVVLRTDRGDDLFEGDTWFQTADAIIEEEEVDVSSTTMARTRDETKDLGEIDNDLDEEVQESGVSNESVLNEGTIHKPVVFGGLCRTLLNQSINSGGSSTEGVIPYKAACLSGLSMLMNSVAPSRDSRTYESAMAHERHSYNAMAPSLYAFASSSQSSGKSTPPLLVARAIECLASAMYEGLGSDPKPDQVWSDAVLLLKFLADIGGAKQAAWTVRQMATDASSSLVSKMPPVILKRNAVITTCLSISSQGLRDKKFWKVRLSSLNLVLSLLDRVGNQKMSTVDPDRQLIMESILPYKENIMDLARRSLSDNESQVTATASKITLAMSWWP